ncbi:alpha/beta hydrolase [Roseinatronobacter sp.]
MEQDHYRNRDFIPDFDAIMAETAARSRELATRAELRADLAYGSSPRERMDILLPTRPTKGAPVHLFIHGGYWRAGSKEDHRLVAAPVLAAGGIAAIATYDLMPGTRLAAIVGQARMAARHLVQLAPELGGDPRRLTVSGHSAGAHLASYLAAQGPEDAVVPDLPHIRGMLLVSGIFDLSGIPTSFLKDEAMMRPDEAEAWSPLTANHATGPHRIVTRGELETAPFQEQATKLVARLDLTAPGAELRCEAGCNHLNVVLALADTNCSLGQRLMELVVS